MSDAIRLSKGQLEAEEFIRTVWWPAVNDAPDGGAAITRALVGGIFQHAGLTDQTTGLEMVAELMVLARLKAELGRNYGHLPQGSDGVDPFVYRADDEGNGFPSSCETTAE